MVDLTPVKLKLIRQTNKQTNGSVPLVCLVFVLSTVVDLITVLGTHVSNREIEREAVVVSYESGFSEKECNTN